MILWTPGLCLLVRSLAKRQTSMVRPPNRNTYRKGRHPIRLGMAVVQRILAVAGRYSMAMNVNSLHRKVPCDTTGEVGIRSEMM
jgi:hypothetical protein